MRPDGTIRDRCHLARTQSVVLRARWHNPEIHFARFLKSNDGRPGAHGLEARARLPRVTLPNGERLFCLKSLVRKELLSNIANGAQPQPRGGKNRGLCTRVPDSA